MESKLSLSALHDVKTVICHRNSAAMPCPDGLASALLIADALPGRSFQFASHGREVDAIEPVPGALFCDVTPSLHTAARWAELGAIVLDHHDTARDVVAMFGGRGIFAEHARQSGASLAFLHVWAARKAPKSGAVAQRALHFATLAAVRDTWDREHPLWADACEQAEALVFYGWEGIVEEGPFAEDAHLPGKMGVGKILRANRLKKAAALAASAMRGETAKGTRVAVVNDLDTSDAAELVDADVLAGFEYFHDGDEVMVRFGLRSRDGYNVGAIAKANGGGGHSQAAGFTVRGESEAMTIGALHVVHRPWLRIVGIIDQYERER